MLSEVPWGTHFCLFYETKQDLLDTVVPYLKAGLESREFCLWVVSDDDPITLQEATTALAQAVPDFEQHLSSGNIEILNGLDWYLDNGVFNLEKVLSAWVAKLDHALALGYEGMRVSGDTFWLREEDWKDFSVYEKKLNDSIKGRPMNLLCTYSLAKSGASEILNVVQLHRFAIARRQGEWKVIETPELTQAKAEIKRLSEQLHRVTKPTATSPVILRYGVAVMAVAIALILTLWMRLEIGQPSTPIVGLFLCAVMFSAWFGGIRPGLLAVALSILAFNYYFVSPPYSWTLEIKEIPRLFVFALSALFVGSLSAAQRNRTESLRQARDVLDETVEELNRTNQALRIENAERMRAQSLLHEKEQEFRAIVENAPDQIIRYDKAFRRMYVNPAVEKFYGMPAEALIGKTLGSGIPEGGMAVKDTELAQVRQGVAAVFATAKTYDYEMSWTMPSGRTYFSIRLFPELDTNGAVVNVLGISRDITESKRAEEELKKEKEVLEKIFENIPVMIGFVGEDGRVKLVNPEWERSMGWTLKELQDQNVDIFAEAYPDLPYRQEVLDFVNASTGEWVDLKIRVRDGRVIDAACAVVHLSEGTRVAIAQDITERKQAEEKLRQSESQLAEAQHLANIGSWSLDLSNNIVTWSDELYRIFGVQPSEFDHNYEAVIATTHPEDREWLRNAIEDAIKTHVPLSVYYRITKPTGELRVLHARGAVVTDVHGNARRLHGTAQDVTERMEAEEKVRATTEQLRALSARLQSAKEEEDIRIARELHDEMGSALTSLRWEIERFDETVSEVEDLPRLQALRNKIKDMMSLTDIILGTMRRIASELRPSILDDLGLVAAIEWQSQQFQLRTGIVCHCDRSLEEVELDGEQSTAIFRILQETLTNILRHAQATRVDIEMHSVDDYFILSVSDDGKGITESEKSDQQSFGILGMRERAHLINAEIEIQGTEGQGTVVTVRVPILSKRAPRR